MNGNSRALLLWALTIIFSVVGTGWFIGSRADARFARLQGEIRASNAALAEQRARTEEKEQAYRLLVKQGLEADAEQQRALSSLRSQLRQSQRALELLRAELAEQREQTDADVAGIAQLADVQLAGDVQNDANQLRPGGLFEAAAPDLFQANRKAAEAFRESFLRWRGSQNEIRILSSQAAALAEQVGNWKQQAGEFEASQLRCNARESACSDTLAEFQAERERYLEALSLRDQQIKALKQRGFWRRFRSVGTHALVAGAAYAAGKASGN